MDTLHLLQALYRTNSPIAACITTDYQVLLRYTFRALPGVIEVLNKVPEGYDYNPRTSTLDIYGNNEEEGGTDSPLGPETNYRNAWVKVSATYGEEALVVIGWARVPYWVVEAYQAGVAGGAGVLIDVARLLQMCKEAYE